MSAPESNRKRFYETASAAEREDGGFEIQLDGRTVKTPAGHALAVPSRKLADAIAEEWNAQGPEIKPATLPLTRLANSAIDGVAGKEAEVIEDIVNYAATDLLCYRVSSPAALVAEQSRLWNPILSWVRSAFDAPFAIGTGLKHFDQPTSSLDSIRSAIAPLGPFRLAALHVMTTLTGSALIALAHVKGFLDAEAAWAAAHVDENWQISQWGEDFEAANRQKNRLSDFLNASRFFKLV